MNRLQKVLETANLKLAAVATDVMGKSGRDMLDALVAGTTDAEILAELARGKLRKKLPELREALDGRIEKHHRLLLRLLLEHMDFLEQTLAQLQQEIEEHLRPYEEAMQLLMSIPGIQALSVAAILAEIGIDMSRFPSAKHLASWAGLCLIEQHKQEFPVVVMCQVLDVSESGFYAWRKRPPCQRQREDAQLTEEIR